MAMEIWNHECGPFWPNFAVFAIVGILELPYLHGVRDLARMKRVIIVAYDRWLNAIELRICSSGSSRVIKLLVRSMIPPFAPHAAFCPIRAFIPSVNSKQPV